ncbi:unnamed protein product [Candidatus Protochlamydia amoebophila UWE25]|uniref:Uncharacterized protein n=1 Tax=Protochlamydia amoebophila (strain UWE25) TaxID=264201 RepID=Q6MB75_PARUW|nr:unnamed protein product [Candidatus Protochlamydia amoebophila UWE25]
MPFGLIIKQSRRNAIKKGLIARLRNLLIRYLHTKPAPFQSLQTFDIEYLLLTLSRIKNVCIDRL